MLTGLAAAGSFAWSERDSIVGAVGGFFGGGDSPCDGQPSTEAVAHMLTQISDADLAYLDRLYRGANEGRPLPTNDPFKLAKDFFGGSDCKASRSPEMPQILVQMVAKYAGGYTPATYVPETRGVTQRTIDAARAEAEALPGRIRDAAIEEIARSGETVAQPVVRARAEQRLADALPYILAGVFAVLILRRK